MAKDKIKNIRVFIASPGDLVEERKAFRKAINLLNSGFGDGAGVKFVSLGWEDVLASTGRRNQGVINQKIDSCDVFILAMNRRWGQESPDAKPYSSYTEEEFHRALERWKETKSPEIFVFFKRVDAESEATPDDKLQKVIKFRKQLEESKTVLYRHYDSKESFLDEIDKHLRAFAKGELPKADEQLETVVFPIEALDRLKKAQEDILQRIEEAKIAKDEAESSRLLVNRLQLEIAEDAAKLSKEGKIEFAREKFVILASESNDIRILLLVFEFFVRTGDLDNAKPILEDWLKISGEDNKSEEAAAAYSYLVFS